MFKELLIKLARSFNAQNIPYMIVGGQAVLLYGEPRLTRDIDVTVGLGPERLDDILALAGNISLKPLPANPQEFVTTTMVLPLEDEGSGVRVDIIFSFTPYEKEALARANEVMIENAMVRFAASEDVIIHKLFAGRPRDIEDAKTIMARQKNIDAGYILNWLTSFDQTFPEKKLLELLKSL
jgi:predicted nucleotidyltransferase